MSVETSSATNAAGARALESARAGVRWAATHGVTRAVMHRRARSGNPDAVLLVDPAHQADPFSTYERMRTAEPFTTGAFSRVTVHHDVCTSVLRSEDFGVADRNDSMPTPIRLALRLAGPPPHAGPIDPPSMLAVDAPDHTRYRRLVSRAFTPRAVGALRERTETIASDLLDAMQAGPGSVDLVDRYASLLPVTVISEMLGAPADMRSKILAWGDGAASSLDMGLERQRFHRVEADVAALHDWMTAHLRRLRRDPGDDLLSRMATVSDDDGSGLSEAELVSTALLVLAAGFETTVNLVTNGTALLFAHPEQRARLAADPSLWPNAVDEILRYDSPVQRTARRARRDTRVHGVDVAAGDLVVTVLAAANRDPRVFADPDVVDVNRTNARDHLAFSGGVHFCLGAALARMEGEVALRALFERFADLAPAGAPHRRPTRILRGYDAMPVTLGVSWRV